jgi:hypothetical protein
VMQFFITQRKRKPYKKMRHWKFSETFAYF